MLNKKFNIKYIAGMIIISIVVQLLLFAILLLLESDKFFSIFTILIPLLFNEFIDNLHYSKFQGQAPLEEELIFIENKNTAILGYILTLITSIINLFFNSPLNIIFTILMVLIITVILVVFYFQRRKIIQERLSNKS